MAKNLKLSVKNTQLAAALKLDKIKKPSALKKKKTEATSPVEEAPIEQKEKIAAPVEVPPAPPAPLPVEELPPPKKAAPAPAYEEPEIERPKAPIHREPAPLPRKEFIPPSGQKKEFIPPSANRREFTPAPPGQKKEFIPPHQNRHFTSRMQGQGQTPPGFTPRPYQGNNASPYHRPRPQIGGGGFPPRREGQGPGYYRPPGASPYPPREGFAPRRPPGAPRDIPRTEEPLAKKKPSYLEDTKPKHKPGFKDFRETKTPRKEEASTFDARDRQGLRDNPDGQMWRKKRTHKMRPAIQEEVIRPKQVKVRIPITVKDLASEMKLKASQLIAKLFIKGVVLTLNDFLDDETTIQLLGHEFDCEILIDTSEEERIRITDKTIKQEVLESPADMLIFRSPVVTFMGHVDHGKTSLIDAIRKTNIASGEAGAITQHIGAFKCHTAVGDLTILDTPGHEAFSAMRARGADVTDIVVLVVAGDEGIRTQTLEAINQAQAAQVPIVVVLNKCDKPNFNADNVYRQLADNNLLPESWGGQTITVNCSAVTGQGIKELLEMLALQAEILELKANPASRARGTVIESEMHKGMGAVVTVLVQNGTLRLGDAIVFAQHHARIKNMQDEQGKELLEAGPSTPVKITGISGLPAAGSEFIVVKNEQEARDLAEKRTEGHRALAQQKKRGGLEGLLEKQADESQKKVLNLILLADVQGSVEALKTSLMKIASKKVELNIISASVGEISESNIQLAAASKATIIGFHTQIERHAESLIKKTKVVVKMHDIIYHAVDDVTKLMLGLLDKIAQENDTGSAEVKAVFKASQLGNIAGCTVLDGTIRRNQHIRVLRDKAVVWKGPIASLKRVKEDVREVSKGYECGILLQNFNDVKVGDILQAFEIIYLEQEL